VNHHIILDQLTKYQDRVNDLANSLDREHEEALLRSQTMLMLDRNVGKHHISKRVLQRFKKCMATR
jgi:hypothetical protein|tara:strand:- start:311 stop:508 length:198 start_codon:yes stop_codon:yes gene_type:complete